MGNDPQRKTMASKLSLHVILMTVDWSLVANLVHEVCLLRFLLVPIQLDSKYATE